MTEEQDFDIMELMENIQATFDHLIRENPMGEGKKDALRVKCDVFSIAVVSLVLLVLNFGCTSNRSNLWILS
ncbi:MAG: hypothetical protein ACYTFW_23060, partial [Planctomycetota bacterium]